MARADEANDLAVMVAETYLAWSEIARAQYISAPSGASAGIEVSGGSANVDGSPRARILTQMWEQVAGRSAVVSIVNFDASGTYTLSIDGVDYSSATPPDVAAAYSQIAGGIAGDASAPVDAVATGTEITITPRVAAVAPHPDYGIASSITSGGSAAFEIVAEPVAISVKIMGYPGTLGATAALSGWQPVARGDLGDTIEVAGEAGGHLSWPIGGFERLALYAETLTGAYLDDDTVTLTPYRLAIGVSRVY